MRRLALIGVALATVTAFICGGTIALHHYRRVLAVVYSLTENSAKNGAEIARLSGLIEATTTKLENGVHPTFHVGKRAPDLAGVIRSVTIALTETGAIVPPSMARIGPLFPVSMARIGPNQLLIANYHDIYLFDEKKLSAYPIRIEGSVPLWVPTAVFYSSFYDRVFIANYTGKDIVIADVVRTSSVPFLRVVERLTDASNIIGAEGVAVSKGGRYLAVADYDGAALSIFEMIDNAWTFKWRRPLKAAHGVVIVGSDVYASGEQIVRFDIATGEEIAHASASEGRPFLFVACLDEERDGNGIIASDPMAGNVFTLTRDLAVTQSFGANGPGRQNLSMPYCAYRDGDAIAVLSSYQDRLIRIGRDETVSYEFGTPWTVGSPAEIMREDVDEWSGPLKVDSPSFTLMGRTWRSRFGSLAATDDNTVVWMPAPGEIADSDWPFYITTIARSGEITAIIANSSPVALLFNARNGEMSVSQIGEWNCWATNIDILCPSRHVSVEDLAIRAVPLPHKPGEFDVNATSQSIVTYWQHWLTTQ
jgi:hypothetical protein